MIDWTKLTTDPLDLSSVQTTGVAANVYARFAQ